MKKINILSVCLGLLLIFLLQVLSLIYNILMESGYRDGWVNKHIFLQPELLVIPCAFIIIPIYKNWRDNKR